jgi:tRNA G26 N,N-dimethylase Trm1
MAQNEKRKECPDSEKETIVEGKAELLLSLSKNVFYNPVQEFNRDLRYILFEMCLRLCHACGDFGSVFCI